MTIEYAIRILDPETSRDALWKYEDKEDRLKVFNEACRVAVDALRAQYDDPLTLEELREMDGEPVWVVGVSCINDFKGHWDICDWENGEVVTFPYCMESPDILDYGINWQAYRRKPEEGTTHE